MGSAGESDTDRRGRPWKIALLFVGLTAAGTLLLLSQDAQPLPQAVVTALVLAIPFSLYAWYVGWGR